MNGATGRHVLYRFDGSDGTLLYVGITCRPSKRFERHREEKEWWSEVATIRLEHFADRPSVLEAERRAIADEKPKYNVRLQDGSVDGDARPAREADRAVGLWFHSIKEGKIEWQGQVVDRAGPHGYKVQLYSWLDGCPSSVKLVTHEEIQGWRFYPTDDLMRIASTLERCLYPRERTIHCPRCDSLGEVFVERGENEGPMRPKPSSTEPIVLRTAAELVAGIMKEAENPTRMVVVWRRGARAWVDLADRADLHTYGYGCGKCPPVGKDTG